MLHILLCLFVFLNLTSHQILQDLPSTHPNNFHPIEYIMDITIPQILLPTPHLALLHISMVSS